MSKRETDEIVVPVEATETFHAEAAEVTGKKQRVFSEEDVELIRKQEKDKLYKRLEEADGRTKALEEQISLLARDREEALNRLRKRHEKKKKSAASESLRN